MAALTNPLAALVRRPASVLWTPDSGASSGLLVAVKNKPLAIVIGGQIIERGNAHRETQNAARETGRGWHATVGGVIIMSSMRHKEPTRVVGHPDLASGASVQRGDILYVSVAEAIYRETRGENVEVHFEPTPADNHALLDLRSRARHRWDSDRLPDGWTRPLPPPHAGLQKTPQEKSLDTASAADTSATSKNGLPDNLREIAERFLAKSDPSR